MWIWWDITNKMGLNGGILGIARCIVSINRINFYDLATRHT
jgi:hypothetical protein